MNKTERLEAIHQKCIEAFEEMERTPWYLRMLPAYKRKARNLDRLIEEFDQERTSEDL